MRWLSRIIRVVSWPLWLKLTIAFLIAIVLPILLLLLVVQNSIKAIDRQNTLNDLEGLGKRELTTLTTQLTNAQTTLSNFNTASTYNHQMAAVLTGTNTTSADVRDMALTMQNLLIGSNDFVRLRLINSTGRLVVDVTRSSILPTGDSLTDNPAFQQATAALLQGESQSVTVYNSGVPTMAMSEAIRDASGQVAGFLIGVADTNTVLSSLLATPETNLPLYSYLVTPGQNPVVITLFPMLDAAKTSSGSHSDGIDQILKNTALNKNGVYGTYNIGASHNLEVYGFYAPVPNPANGQPLLFTLVSEVPTSAVVGTTTQFLAQGSPFVLAIGMIVLLIILVLLFNQMIMPPLNRLRHAIQSVVNGNFDVPLPAAGRGDELGGLSASFVDMRTHVRHLLDDLQIRVASRTRDINATHEISRYAATQRDLQTLMDQVVKLIVEEFPNIYHAQIFLLDLDRNFAILRASTGDAGKALLARGHRLASGSISLVGQAVEQGQTVIARDTAASQVWRPNELLPDTRAELTIPLRVGETVIGVLDVQSKFSNAFTEDEINILQTMSDQIALAIENARLYQESVRRLEEIERTNRQAILKTWQEYVYGQRQRQLSSHAGVATGNDLSELRRRAIAQGKVVMGEATDHSTVPIAVPILLKGQTLGAVEWELPVTDITENKLQLAQELANRLAVSLDNARLFQESQRAAERERIVNSIAARLTPQTEISEILQTAVREVGQALRAPQVSIRLHHPGQPADTQSNGNGVSHTNGNSSNGNGNGNGVDHLNGHS